MENQELIEALNKNIPVMFHHKVSLDDMKIKIAAYVNELIQSDFQKLIVLLYRIDVSEAKLKSLLQQIPGEDAGKIIAALIIERQIQKIKSRQQFTRPAEDGTDEEKW